MGLETGLVGPGNKDRVWGRTAHLNLLVLENSVDAAVEGGAGEHGRGRVGEVQNRLQH